MKDFEAQICRKLTGFVISHGELRTDYVCYVAFGMGVHDAEVLEEDLRTFNDRSLAIDKDRSYSRGIVVHYFRGLDPFCRVEFEGLEVISRSSLPEGAPQVDTDKHRLWVSQGPRKRIDARAE